jgi:hypothetical protein
MNPQTLDLMYRSVFENINREPLHFVDSLNDGITFFNDADGAFSLNEPASGPRFVYPFQNYNEFSAGFIIRTVISYAECSKFNKDYFYGLETLIILKNHLLAKAASFAKLKECKKITFKRPNGSIFGDTEGYAGFEIRLYVELEKETKK